VVTESTKSLRYRWEYWQGAWGVIRGGPRTWWQGVGPGNFGGHYLRHKRPWSSEAIADPHNLVLEVWATAGLPAALALLAALGTRPARPPPAGDRPRPPSGERSDPPEIGPTTSDRTGWLVAWAGLGGWLLVAVPEAWGGLGRINPFRDDDLIRWGILGMAWLGAVLLGAPLWRRRPIPAGALGAAALAVVVNLLAAGGIGMPAVALGLWTLLALGQDLRADRPCGRLRAAGGRGAAFALAAVASALIGAYLGAVVPCWRAEAAMAEAQEALAARPPDLPKAQDAYRRAGEADAYSARPWLALADLEFRSWLGRGAPVQERAVAPDQRRPGAGPERPRNPNSLQVQGLRGFYARQILGMDLPLPPTVVHLLRNQVMDALGKSAKLDPTNATTRAQLAESLAERGHTRYAVAEAEEALSLDRITPHADRKLPADLRQRLLAHLGRWKAELSSQPEGAPALPRDSAWGLGRTDPCRDCGPELSRPPGTGTQERPNCAE
jgi:hypothetical protein